MLNDRELSKVCWTLYLDQPTDYWDRLFPHDGGYVGIKQIGDEIVVCWRGSTTLFDWLEDFQAVPVMDHDLGMVHSGFLGGVNSIMDSVTAAVASSRVYVIGHSLGAGHAAIHAAKLILAGRAPQKVTLWGCPRPGFQQLRDILNRPKFNITSYKNRKDPVTDVPVNIGDFKYVDATTFYTVNVAPSLMDAWGPLADHHFNLYATAMEALYPPKT
jgi:hypothetical protein